MVEIRKAHWAIQAAHTPAPTPLGNSIQQSLEHIIVINKVEPSETALLNSPSLIGAVVDDAHYATYDLVVTIGHIYYEIANLKRGIALRIEGVYLVKEYWRTVVWVTLIQVYSELYESLEFTLCCYLFNNNIAWISYRHNV